MTAQNSSGFRLARSFRRQGLARRLRRARRQMERQCLGGSHRLLPLRRPARLRVLPGRPEHARPLRPVTHHYLTRCPERPSRQLRDAKSGESVPDLVPKHPAPSSRHMTNRPLPASSRMTPCDSRKWPPYILYGPTSLLPSSQNNHRPHFRTPAQDRGLFPQRLRRGVSALKQSTP